MDRYISKGRIGLTWLALAWLTSAAAVGYGQEVTQPEQPPEAVLSPPEAPLFGAQVTPGLGQVVTVKPVAALLVEQQEQAAASVVALREAWVAAQVSAPILELHAETGDRVAWGAVLARQDTWSQGLEHARAKAALGVLESQLLLAKQQLEQVEKLGEQEATGEALMGRRRGEKQVLEARIVEAKSAVEQAVKQVEKGVIHAPFSGVVLDRKAQLGGWSDVGSPLFQLVDPVRVMLEATIPAASIKSMKMAKRWYFVHASGQVEVKLENILPRQEETTQTLRVRFRFDRDKPLPGSSGQLVWQDEQRWIEPDLLVERNNKLGLFIVDDQQVAHFVALPHAQAGQRAQLLSLFTPDMPIVIMGRDQLQDGQQVVVSQE
ncbi:efflux transporter, RND family, MFP subunit [Magnetococcus marinus MC-1]|uniref:Efflux transporter, RND family, MFP subunit n=1 Tax=Magnetococcus marinus (strain ATCC BAA-1437 / JCM 17883 / MC-1) TaxID=156889 RepID=A0L4E3_MAGMM|nr:efflux RND transporter periplasmic adaptor subunit [Magnetococcus marinus]ABK42836.1 efflux transporter, RND family, MFP subunit [Magnetococcus marinus MC-1]